MVSIIIPIYNPGDKLRVCLDSIKSQTYHDIEVLMVNDGSKDNSASICKEFAKEDERFVYIEQENAGVSMARNKGIVHSHGDYICFVDSDDSVEPCYVECMVKTMVEMHVDIVLQGLNNLYDGRLGDKKVFPNLIVKVGELDDKMFEELFYFCGPYCKLFRADYIHNNKIEFPPNMAYGEDFVFYVKYLYLCRSISFLSKTFYNYSVAVTGSLSSVRLHPDKFWANQVNRRGEYKKLRKQYGIEQLFYPTENKIKLVALRGLLSSIKHAQASLKEYLNIVVYDKDFGFSDILPLNIFDKLLLFLMKSNNYVSRFILKTIIK